MILRWHFGHGRRLRSTADLPGPTRPPEVNLSRPCLIRALCNAQDQGANAGEPPRLPWRILFRVVGPASGAIQDPPRQPLYSGKTQPPAQNASAPHAQCAASNAANDTAQSPVSTASCSLESLSIVASSDRPRNLRSLRVKNPRFLVFQCGPMLAFGL